MENRDIAVKRKTFASTTNPLFYVTLALTLLTAPVSMHGLDYMVNRMAEKDAREFSEPAKRKERVQIPYRTLPIPTGKPVRQTPEQEKKDEPKQKVPEYRNPDQMPVKGAGPSVAGYRPITNFNECSDIELLSRMIWAEARGCSDNEMAAVAYTALNRTRQGKNLRQVILAPKQYSAFNGGDKNYRKTMDPMRYEPGEYLRSYRIAEGVLNGSIKDITGGATHYDLRGCNPPWLKSPEFKRVEVPDSKHVFLKPARHQRNGRN